MRALEYALDEAIASLRRAGRAALMAIGAISVAFIVFGGFLIVLTNLQRVVADWAAAAELSVYLRDEATDEDLDRLAGRLTGDPAVAGVEHVSKAQARGRFQEDFPELADVAAGLEDNPFPASLEVRLQGSDAEAAAALASLLAADAAVADVRYDQRWLTRLTALVSALQVAGLSVALVLVLGAALTVMAVVRLSLQARRDELDIMLLVGAPFAYLRGPFIVEGTLQGGLGAAFALVALWAAHAAVVSLVGDAWQAMTGAAPPAFLGARDLLLIVAAGLGVGAAAGTLASRSAR